MASFLIVDSRTPLDQGCDEAYQILATAWKMNPLHAKFICHHKIKGPFIYSYNHYTNQAPISWQLEKTYTIKNEHPWTLSVQSYKESQEVCNDLNFDKKRTSVVMKFAEPVSNQRKSIKLPLTPTLTVSLVSMVQLRVTSYFIPLQLNIRNVHQRILEKSFRDDVQLASLTSS